MIENLPPLSPKTIALKIKPSVEKIIRKGHPWLFEAGITKQNKEGNAGDLTIIFDNQKNKFLAIGLYDPHSPIRVKILQANKSAKINAEWFREKINAAYEKRKPLFETETNSYRFLHGENDGLPSFIADVYADVLVVKLYALIWLPYLKDLFPILLEISQCKTLVLRLSRNVQQKTEELHGLHDGQILFGTLENEVIVFKEHDVLFSANVIHGHKTGYFLDHRHNRKKVGELSKNKTVLDVFSYAGGFSVHALHGGAKEVISLDISAQALKIAKQNVALNNLQAKHQTLVGDAFQKMQELANRHQRFDIIIVDPPSFAKRDSEVEKALNAYAQLTKLAIELVAKNGTLVTASCSSRVSADDFFEVVLFQLKQSNRSFREVERTFHDIDHPIGFEEGKYLKCGYFRLD
ncbi:MAG: class I SAM-dependent rRNA methyltransferase [Bacteroidetes bacterium]|jgi:23S rRNA (cytosine1962-C5)-methyltransferase|nr:class I SAM-dependent rRNA methyltransferase [Bacteroidota bacterium]